jgi:hypothetical protein
VGWVMVNMASGSFRDRMFIFQSKTGWPVQF